MLRTINHIMPHHSLEEKGFGNLAWIPDSSRPTHNSLDSQVLYSIDLEQVRVPLSQGVRAIKLVFQSGAVVLRQVLGNLTPLLVDVAPAKDIHLQLPNNPQDGKVMRNM